MARVSSKLQTPRRLTAADLAYDAETHTTQAPDGRAVPHVTAILEAVGVSTDFEELSSWGPRMAARIETARLLGDAVHKDCHAYDDDDLDLDAVHPDVVSHVEAWARCRIDEGLEPVSGGRERRLFHDLFWYTGITDGVFRRRDGALVLVDLKTGDPESAACHLQTAAYEAAWLREHPDMRISARWAIRLTPSKRIPYRVLNYTARSDAYLDFAKFQACLTVFNEQPARRRRIQ